MSLVRARNLLHATVGSRAVQGLFGVVLAAGLGLGSVALASPPDAASADAEPAGDHAEGGDHGEGAHGGDHGDDHGEGAHGGDHAGGHHLYSADDDHDGTANWLDSDSDTYVVSSVAFHAVNFLIFAGILYFGAGATIRDGVRNRALFVRRDLDEAAKVRGEAQARHDAVSARLAKLEEEIAAMETRAKADAAAEEAALVARGEAQAASIAETTQRQIRDEVARARAALRAEAVELAVALAEGIVKEKVGAADQRRLAAEFLTTIQAEG